MTTDAGQYCAHCGARRSPKWTNCHACGSSFQLEAVATRPNDCARCGNSLAESWRYCPGCGAATPIAHHPRSMRTTIDGGSTDAAKSESPALPETPRHAQPLAESAFDDLASRHMRHRNRHVAGLEPEIVEDEPSSAAPAMELISRPPAPEAPDAAEGFERSEVVQSPIEIEPGRPPAADPLDAGHAEPERHPPASQAPRAIAAAGHTVQLEPPGVDRARFRDPARAGQYAQLALLVLGLAATFAIVALIVLNNRVADISTGAADAFDNAVGVEGFINGWIRPALLAAAAAALILTAAWTAVVYRNLRAAGRDGMRVGDWGAIWSWFVPGVNLVLPKRIIDDAWRGAAPDAWRDKDWMLRPGNMWTNVFWWALMGAIALTFVGWRVGGATVETALDANGWGILGLGALVIAALAGVRMITAIDTRQLELIRRPE